MKHSTTLLFAMALLGMPVLAQASFDQPGSNSHPSLKDEREKQHAIVRQDHHTFHVESDKLEADKRAGNVDAVKQDKEMLKATRVRLQQDRDALKDIHTTHPAAAQQPLPPVSTDEQ